MAKMKTAAAGRIAKTADAHQGRAADHQKKAGMAKGTAKLIGGGAAPLLGAGLVGMAAGGAMLGLAAAAANKGRLESKRATKEDNKAVAGRNRATAVDYLAKRGAKSGDKQASSGADRTKPYTDSKGRFYANGRAITRKG